MADLTADFGKFTLKNPVTTASGTFGHGLEYQPFYNVSELGAVAVKGIRSIPSDGNPTPRACEVTGGMLNAIGLQGPGVDAFLHDGHYLPALRKLGATVFVNIWGTSVEEYAAVAAALDAEPDGITALEINISCPNVKHGGSAFGTDLGLAREVVAAVRGATALPLITKLSPNVSNIGDFAEAVADAGSDAVSLINTLTGMAIDIERRGFKIANRTGGLSGPAVKPVAVRMVYEVAHRISLPILGMGGIMTAADAVEFLMAGATAVAVGTANFVDPYAPLKVLRGLDAWLDAHGVGAVSEIVGAVR